MFVSKSHTYVWSGESGNKSDDDETQMLNAESNPRSNNCDSDSDSDQYDDAGHEGSSVATSMLVHNALGH